MRGEQVFLIFIMLTGSIWLLTPVMRALAERIKPRSAGLEPAARDELLRFREDVLEEVNQLRREVGELSERVDFTERWLAKQSGQALPRQGA